LLVVVGPCSIHDIDAARDYADRLGRVAEQLRDQLLLVMRVYFEKPRTALGWKGLINDPFLNQSYRINHGLRLARQLLLELAERRLGAATEFLDTTLGQFYADLVCWAAIGARTTESQIHRELASGLSMPVGFKNRTDGDIQVAVDAIISARERHLFPSLTLHGSPAIFETTGNRFAHLVLRGGAKTGPNYDVDSIAAARSLLSLADVETGIMVDCSHGNSEKQPERQSDVAREVARQRVAGNSLLTALMIESHLVGGRQAISEQMAYGQSVTDACLSFAETERLLCELAEKMARARAQGPVG
jgi:3-deoxy-7-phosphoheptulonate synthase